MELSPQERNLWDKFQERLRAAKTSSVRTPETPAASAKTTATASTPLQPPASVKAIPLDDCLETPPAQVMVPSPSYSTFLIGKSREKTEEPRLSFSLHRGIRDSSAASLHWEPLSPRTKDHPKSPSFCYRRPASPSMSSRTVGSGSHRSYSSDQ